MLGNHWHVHMCTIHRAMYTVHMSLSHYKFTTWLSHWEVERIVVVLQARAVTTVQQWISTFVSVTLLDFFKETAGSFPAMFLATKLDIVDEMSGHFQSVCGNKTVNFWWDIGTFYSWVRGNKTAHWSNFWTSFSRVCGNKNVYFLTRCQDILTSCFWW